MTEIIKITVVLIPDTFSSERIDGLFYGIWNGSNCPLIIGCRQCFGRSCFCKVVVEEKRVTNRDSRLNQIYSKKKKSLNSVGNSESEWQHSCMGEGVTTWRVPSCDPIINDVDIMIQIILPPQLSVKQTVRTAHVSRIDTKMVRHTHSHVWTTLLSIPSIYRIIEHSVTVSM